MSAVVSCLSLMWLLFLPCVSYAHHPDPTGDLSSMGSGFEIGGGLMVEGSHDEDPVRFLVSVAFRGFDRATGDHHVRYRYFWVSVQALLSPWAPGGGMAMLPSITVNLVPATEIRTTHGGTTSAIRYFPTEIRRDLGARLAGSVSVQAVGWAWYGESALDGSYDEHKLARWIRFADIAVDLIGLRVASVEEAGWFVGGQVGSFQASAGLGWNINESASLRVSLGGRVNGALGSLPELGEMSVLGETDLFFRIQFLLNKAVTQFRLFAEGGYHYAAHWRPFAPELPEQPHAHTGGGHEHGTGGHDHGSDHGHPYLLFGFAGRF